MQEDTFITDYSSTPLCAVYLSLPLSSDEGLIGGVASILEDEAVSVSWVKGQSAWEVQWVFASPAPIQQLKNAIIACGHTAKDEDFRTEDIPETNWLEESYRTFPPFSIGRFFIYGSHYKEGIPKNALPLQIDAATAFGSGEHGTTKGCIEALQYLDEAGFKPKRILDMGAGSGILGIAAYKLWKKPVLAVDIDKEATRVACRHRRINAVPAGEKGMTCATGDGYAARLVTQQKKGFDFIIANILAGPLVMMAPDLAKSLSKGGKVILSGLLVEQEKEVLTAHKAQGLSVEKRITHGEWRTLILSA